MSQESTFSPGVDPLAGSTPAAERPTQPADDVLAADVTVDDSLTTTDPTGDPEFESTRSTGGSPLDRVAAEGPLGFRDTAEDDDRPVSDSEGAI